jgi:hemerythrin-like domain-containing protein
MSADATDRRTWIAGAAAGAALLAAGGALARAKDEADAPEIPPTEDLMREHGILRRILILYAEAEPRLGQDDAAVLGAIAGGAAVVRRFVEGYHEKLEEQFLIPRLQKAGKLVDLCQVILTQHAVGRRLTDQILTAAKARDRRAATKAMRSFSRMYTAHAAWEDTQVFPAYRALFTEAQLDRLGEQFEAQEHKLLGPGGFEGSLKEVFELEEALGIHDLAKFTPL